MSVSRALALLVALLLTPAGVAAQAAPAACDLHGFRAAVTAAEPDSVIHRLIPSLRSAASDSCSRLKLGFALLARGEMETAHAREREALELFTRAVEAQPDRPETWYGLGVARAQLAVSGIPAKEGPLQALGAGFAVGAANALIRALTLDPGFTDAALSLASHRAFDGWEIDAPQPLMRERLIALRGTALTGLIKDASSPAGLWLGRAVLETQVGSLDSAAAYLERYLGAGGDTGVGSYRLARVRYRLGDESAAVAAYYKGAAHSESEDATALYRWNIAWVADSSELVVYDTLPAAEREAWLRMFWGERDAEAGRQEGERLLEHFRRYEYALEHFRLQPSLQAQRAGRASSTAASSGPTTALGTPSGGLAEAMTVTEGQSSAETAMEASKVPERRTGGAAGWAGGPTSAWDAETISWLAGASSYFSHFVSTQQLLDHRGVIYLRHGPPDQRATAVSEHTPANETWKYNASPSPLVFHFFDPGPDVPDGSAGATMLTPLPVSLDAMCGLDSELCMLGMQQAGTRATPGRPMRVTQARRQFERAQEWIRRGSTTDTYVPRYAEPLEPVVQVFALHGRAADRTDGRILVVFAVRGNRLDSRQAPDGSGRTAYPLTVRLIASAPDGTRRDLDTVRTFVTPRPLGKSEHLTGLLELAVPAGHYAVSVRMEATVSDTAPEAGEQSGRKPPIDAEHGALIRLDDVTVPARSGPLTLSDLVLGRAGSGLTWWSGQERVPLNPLNAVPEGGTVHVYYELSGLLPGAEYRTRLAIYDRDDEKRRPLLTLSFAEAASASWQAVTRTLELGRLAEGSYDLEVQVERSGSAKGPHTGGWC